MTDGNGNLISNYIYAEGSSPFMRLDANGNPMYYLTDGMGSVIRLADGAGASTAKFGYDAFGNVRSTSGIAADSTGGDFRFQGQWLESATGLYNFRARDYDSRTGTFLSRDPVDPTGQDPEALNPYQAMYNNPYVYSDPTGMFTLIELNASESIQKTLNSVKSNAARQTLDRFKDKIGEVIGDQIYGFLQKVIPGSERVQKALSAGDKLESFLLKGICSLLQGQPDWLNNLWNEVPLSPRGIPLGNGFNCSARPGTDERKEIFAADRGPTLSDPLNRRGYSVKPDLLFKTSPPLERQPKALIVGDVKINVNRMHEDYVSPGSRRNQWETITRYAKDSRRMYAPLTLYIVGKDGTQREKQDLEGLAISRGVILFLLPIVPR